MLCILADTQTKWILLKMELQLMTFPASSFPTMNATPYWCLFSSPENQILYSSSVEFSLIPVHLTSDSPMMFQQYHLSLRVLDCWKSGCKRWTFGLLYHALVASWSLALQSPTFHTHSRASQWDVRLLLINQSGMVSFWKDHGEEKAKQQKLQKP